MLDFCHTSNEILRFSNSRYQNHKNTQGFSLKLWQFNLNNFNYFQNHSMTIFRRNALIFDQYVYRYRNVFECKSLSGSFAGIMTISWSNYVLEKCHRGFTVREQRTFLNACSAKWRTSNEILTISWSNYVLEKCHRGFTVREQRTFLNACSETCCTCNGILGIAWSIYVLEKCTSLSGDFCKWHQIGYVCACTCQTRSMASGRIRLGAVARGWIRKLHRRLGVWDRSMRAPLPGMSAFVLFRFVPCVTCRACDVARATDQ